MASFDLEMPRGDSRTLRAKATYPFDIPEDDIEKGDPYPLTGKTVWFSAEIPGRPGYVFQKKTGGDGVDVSGSAPNVAVVSIKPVDTVALSRPVVLDCDVQVLDGDDVYTVAQGRLHITKDTTREIA